MYCCKQIVCRHLSGSRNATSSCLVSLDTTYIIWKNVEVFKNRLLKENLILKESLKYSGIFFAPHGIFKINRLFRIHKTLDFCQFEICFSTFGEVLPRKYHTKISQVELADLNLSSSGGSMKYGDCYPTRIRNSD